jgi:hypothetical protein
VTAPPTSGRMTTPFAPRTNKDLIEEALFARRRDLFSDLGIVFFDTTPIYFEGEGGDGTIRFALLLLLSAQQLFPQQLFTNRCAACHGEDARGTAKGPGLAMNPRVAEQSAEQLRAYPRQGRLLYTGFGPTYNDDFSRFQRDSRLHAGRRGNGCGAATPERSAQHF